MEELAARMIGERTFMGWPFLQEGHVSDSLFKYEKVAVTPGSPPRVVPAWRTLQGLSHWKMKEGRRDRES
jgi:hypothetical protein